MDTTKQNPLQGAQESDDLIAELARLVAQDARSQSANRAGYTPPKPEPEPQARPFEATYSNAEPSYEAAQETARFYDVSSEPRHDAGAGQGHSEPVFDFGFARSQEPEPGPLSEAAPDPEHDAIADLIASAEQVDPVAREAAEENDFFNFSVGAQNEPEPVAEPGRLEPAVEPHWASQHPQDDLGALESRSAQQPVTGDPDPLSEIEALIGEAARVSVNGGVNGSRRVRSSFLDTADYQDLKAEQAVDAAESAILAAAAASGARVSHVPEFDEPKAELEAETAYSPASEQSESKSDDLYEALDDAESDRPEHRARRRGGMIVPAVAGTAILALLVGGYFMFLAPGPAPTEAPVLTAEAGDLKEVPESTGTPSTASESVIFNEISGNTVPPEEEALVSRDQTNGATGAEIGSVIAPEEGETLLANRPVRTVTVRPDGTIVASNDGIAGSNVLPVERPDVPAVPNSTLTSDPIGEAIAAAMADESASGPAAAATPETAPDAVATPTPSATAEPTPATTAESGEATEPAEAPAAIDPATIPHPIPRPAGLTSSQTTQPAAGPAQQPTQIAAAPVQTVTPQTPPAAATATPASVGAWVQLSSQRTEEAARADIPSLQSRYGALFGGTPLDVSRVDLGDRGIYYRVRLPQPTMADANSVCNAIKGQGGDCFVLNN